MVTSITYVCRWEHLGVCVETVCHILLVHVDHFARCSPRLHLLSVWLWDKYYRHTFINQPFYCRLLDVMQSLFSSPFATEQVRFRAVVADLIARAPEVFSQEALCLPRVCDRSRGDGWHNGVYLRSHSLTLPSVWHSNQGDTFLLRDVIGAAAHRNCVHEPRGHSEGLL